MDYQQFIISTIKKAGEVLLAHYDESYSVSIKGGDPRDIVTEIDLKINDFLTDEIKKKYPGQVIYSEEIGSGIEKSGSLWTLDPIDGTANFARRIPHFAISMGLIENGFPLAGAVFNPITNELFSFEKSRGAFLNQRPIRVSAISDLSSACIFMLTGKKRELRDWGAALYRKLLDRANKTRNFGSSALDVCFVAAGRIEGVIYGQLTTLDVAPAIGILLEAGGKITDEIGRPLRFSSEPSKIVASNGTALHEELLSLAA